MLVTALALGGAGVARWWMRADAAVEAVAYRGLVWQATLGRPGAPRPAFVAAGSQAAQWARYLDASAALEAAVPVRLVSARILSATVVDQAVGPDGGTVRYRVTVRRRLLLAGRPAVATWTAVVAVTVGRIGAGRLVVTALAYDFDPASPTDRAPRVSYLDTDLRGTGSSPLGE
ncbi:MAG: hypothetical protein K6V97_12735 [Actinomycetia bacterium]|nr:hypothetical protein [Actinomycetes bacterium]